MYMYMMMHPGKKLNFMGNEFGQIREWCEKREQDWELRKYPIHDSFYHYMSELNQLYLKHPAMSAWDYKEEGFLWLDCHQEGRCIYAILRRSEGEKVAAVFNFSDREQTDYEVRIEGAKDVEVLLYSDWERFNGTTPEHQRFCVMEHEMLRCTLKPFSAVLVQIKE